MTAPKYRGKKTVSKEAASEMDLWPPPHSFFFPVTPDPLSIPPPPAAHVSRTLGGPDWKRTTDIPRHLHMQSVRRDGRHWRRRTRGPIPITVREASLVAWGSKETSVSLPPSHTPSIPPLFFISPLFVCAMYGITFSSSSSSSRNSIPPNAAATRRGP